MAAWRLTEASVSGERDESAPSDSEGDSFGDCERGGSGTPVSLASSPCVLWLRSSGLHSSSPSPFSFGPELPRVSFSHLKDRKEKAKGCS